MDGMSWMPLLYGQNKLEREAIYWHYPHYHQEGAVPYSAIRMGDWKLVDNLESGEMELYNLANDIGESMNLASENSEMLNLLTKKLDTWRTSVHAQFPSINKDYDENRTRKKK